MIKLQAKRFELNFLLKFSDLKSNFTLTLGYLNPALNNQGLLSINFYACHPLWTQFRSRIVTRRFHHKPGLVNSHTLFVILNWSSPSQQIHATTPPPYLPKLHTKWWKTEVTHWAHLLRLDFDQTESRSNSYTKTDLSANLCSPFCATVVEKNSTNSLYLRSLLSSIISCAFLKVVRASLHSCTRRQHFHNSV